MMDAALSLLSGQSVAHTRCRRPRRRAIQDSETARGTERARRTGFPAFAGNDSGAEVTPTGPSGNKNLLNFLAYTVNCFSYGPET